MILRCAQDDKSFTSFLAAFVRTEPTFGKTSEMSLSLIPLAAEMNLPRFRPAASSAYLLLILAIASITRPASAQSLPYTPSSSAIDVQHYDVEITVQELTQVELDAVARITIAARDRLDSIALHVEPDRVLIDSVRSDEGVDLSWSITPGTPNAWGLSGSRLTVMSPIAVFRGETMEIEIHYRIVVQPADDPRGFFFDPDFHGSRVLNTRNWPYFARFWLPGNDHPSDAATFRFTLNVPREMLAVANGRLVSSSTGPGGETRVWEQDEPIPTYALQIVIGELASTEGVLCFDSATGTRSACFGDATRIPTTFVFPALLANRTLFESEIRKAEDALIFFSNAFGPYRFDKAGFASIPHPFSMESASLVTLVSPGDAVHEMLHHWWGNAVHIESWGDFWISEGITTYFTGFFDEVTTGVNTSCATGGKRLNVAQLQDPLDNFTLDPYCIGAAAIDDFRMRLAQSVQLQPEDPEARRQFLEVFSRVYERHAFEAIDTRDLVRALKFSTFQTICGDDQEMRSYDSVSSWVDEWQAQWLTGVPAFETAARRRPASRAPRCESTSAVRMMHIDAAASTSCASRPAGSATPGR